MTHGPSIVVNDQRWLIQRDPVPTGANLRLLSEHVLHEIQSTRALGLLVGQFGRSDLHDFENTSKDYWISEGLVSAFLMHMRSLDEFMHKEILLVNNGTARDGRVPFPRGTLTALDFVRDPQAWTDARPPRHRELEIAWSPINRTVIHLDARRMRDDGEHAGSQKTQSWRTNDLMRALRPTMVAFLDHADPSRLCEGFQFHAQRALRDETIEWD